jgi:hypothetical protein
MTSPAGAVQVYQLPSSQILSAQDGNDVPGAVALMGVQTFPCNRVCEFLGDRYIVHGAAGTSADGVYKKNKSSGDWEQVFSAPSGHDTSISGLVVLHPDGVPTMAYQFYEPDTTADGEIAFTTDGANWTQRQLSTLISGEQPDSSGEVVVYRKSVFWAHSVEIPLAGSTRRVITSHDIELNITTRYTVFDRLLATGAEISLVVHKNKLFAFSVRDNVAAADGNRYELRRLGINGSSGFGAHNDAIHVESDAGGGQYPGALGRGHAAMFTDPASGQLIVIMSGGQSTGTTVAPVGGAKVLRFATADADIAGANAGVDITSTVMSDLGNPTGAGGADRYLTGGSSANPNRVWYVVVDNQTVPGATARVFLWTGFLGGNTECWEWKGINAEMEPVAGLVGIQLNQFSLNAVTAGGGQYYPRVAAIELEGIPEEVSGGTKFEFRGEGESNAGTVTFYSSTKEEAPTTVVPIVGSLTCTSGLFRNLEGYYKFNSNRFDSSGNGRDLNPFGSTVYVGGKFGNAFRNLGTGSNQQHMSDIDAFDFSGAGARYAISCWYDAASIAAITTLTSKTTSNANGWTLTVRTDGSVRWDAASVGNRNTGPSVINPGGTAGFQHIVVTSDGSILKIYVDGVEEFSGSPFIITASTQVMMIGARDNTVEPMNGDIDEVAYWSRGLSVKEVMSLYNAGSGREAETLLTTPSIAGNTIVNFTADGGLCSVVLNPTGIGEGEIGTLIGNLVV